MDGCVDVVKWKEFIKGKMKRGHEGTPTHSFTNESPNQISSLIHQNKAPRYPRWPSSIYVTLQRPMNTAHTALSCLALVSGTRVISR